MGEILLLLFLTWAAKHWVNTPPARGSGRARQPPQRQIPPARRPQLPPTQKPATPATQAPPPKLPQPSPAQAAKASTQAPPWPQAMPEGLPPWPAGWTPAQPPPAAVVTRAWQLLPTLWARGVGSKTVEQTAGTWYTYVATWMDPAKKMKGVVAFKPKGPAPRTAPQAKASA